MSKKIVLSSDHAAIPLRQAVAEHVKAKGFEPVDIGPTTTESTHYPKHGAAAAEKEGRSYAPLRERSGRAGRSTRASPSGWSRPDILA